MKSGAEPRLTSIRWWNSVLVNPGHSAITVTPWPRYSLAAHSAEAVHPGLRRGVAAAGQERRHARDVDDAAVAALAHRAERGVEEPQHRGDQHVQHRGLGVDVVVEEAALEPEARVVDQQLDRPLRVAQPRLHGGEGVAVGEVGGQHLRGHAVRRVQLGRQRPPGAGCRGRPGPGRARGGRAAGRRTGRCPRSDRSPGRCRAGCRGGCRRGCWETWRPSQAVPPRRAPPVGHDGHR